jgi:hypothetical protein
MRALPGGAGCDLLAVGEDRDLIAGPHQEPDVVLDDEDRQAVVVGQLPDDAAELLRFLRTEPDGLLFRRLLSNDLLTTRS